MALEGLIHLGVGHQSTTGNLRCSQALRSSLCPRLHRMTALSLLPAALAVSLPRQVQACLLGPSAWSHAHAGWLFQQAQARPPDPSIRGQPTRKACHQVHPQQDQSALRTLRRRHETPQTPDMGQMCAAVLASPPHPLNPH